MTWAATFSWWLRLAAVAPACLRPNIAFYEIFRLEIEDGRPHHEAMLTRRSAQDASLRILRPILLCGAVAALAACGSSISIQRTGERFAAYPDDCPIDFQYGELTKVMQLEASGYVQVGSITVVKAGDSFDEPMKDKVRPAACQMGANVVIMLSSSPGCPTSTTFTH